MGNIKNIVIIVLVIIIIILGYMLMVTFPEKAEAECTAKCTETVKAQVTSAVQQCMTGAQDCLQMLQQLKQVPACAAVMPQ